jgi:predicted RNA-binding Zn-ribbon protein involved in translation (DUF1610 family)
MSVHIRCPSCDSQDTKNAYACNECGHLWPTTEEAQLEILELRAEVERLQIIVNGRCAKQPAEDLYDGELIAYGEYTTMQYRAIVAEAKVERLKSAWEKSETSAMDAQREMERLRTTLEELAKVDACPNCGSTAWVNIDCHLCMTMAALERKP